MKPVLLKLFSFLIPAGVAIGFLLWWFSPTQTLIRTNTALLETLELRVLSLGNKSEINARFGEFLAESVQVAGSPPLPSETLSRQELIDLHERFQGSLASSTIASDDHTVRFVTSTTAIVTTNVQADLHLAGGQRRVMRYFLSSTYEKRGKPWLLTKVDARLR